MFGRKKEPEPGLTGIAAAMVHTDIGSTLYQSVVEERGPLTTLTCGLEFDDLQRVSGLKNLMIDGLPVVPGFDVVERVSNVSMQLAGSADKDKLQSLQVEIDGQDLSTSATYRTNR